MAKVIRNRWVYRPHGRWHRYLPRRVDGIKEYDYETEGGSLNSFREENAQELEQVKPSKLWLTWLYRDTAGEPKWTKERVRKLFGDDAKVGRAEVLMNTEAINQELWHIKHLIELKPITFPNGEPTRDDIYGISVQHDGTCRVVKDVHPIDEKQLRLYNNNKQWSSKELSRQMDAKYHGCQDVFERNVHTPSNFSQMK